MRIFFSFFWRKYATCSNYSTCVTTFRGVGMLEKEVPIFSLNICVADTVLTYFYSTLHPKTTHFSSVHPACFQRPSSSRRRENMHFIFFHLKVKYSKWRVPPIQILLHAYLQQVYVPRTDIALLTYLFLYHTFSFHSFIVSVWLYVLSHYIRTLSYRLLYFSQPDFTVLYKEFYSSQTGIDRFSLII